MPTPIPDPDDLAFQVAELTDAVNDLRSTVNDDRGSREAQTRALNEQTRALREKLSQSARALRATKRLWFGFAVLVVAGFVVNAAIIRHARHVEDRRQDDATDAAVVNCLNANKARVAREARDEQIGQLLLDAAIGNSPAATPEEAARRRAAVDEIDAAYVAKLRETLPPELQQRDCSVEAVTAPTVVGESRSG